MLEDGKDGLAGTVQMSRLVECSQASARYRWPAGTLVVSMMERFETLQTACAGIVEALYIAVQQANLSSSTLQTTCFSHRIVLV